MMIYQWGSWVLLGIFWAVPILLYGWRFKQKNHFKKNILLVGIVLMFGGWVLINGALRLKHKYKMEMIVRPTHQLKKCRRKSRRLPIADQLELH